MMMKSTISLIVLYGFMFIAASCSNEVHTPAPDPEPELPEPSLPITEFKSMAQAVLLDLTEREDPTDNARQLYSARHILEVSGVPYLETRDVEVALEASLILISSPINVGLLTPEEITLLNNWTNNGGVVISPVCKDEALQALFGFSASPNYHKNRYLMSWVSGSYPELAYFDHENEKTISLGEDNGGNNVIKTYGYSLNETAKALAYFDTDEVAVIRNIKGEGRAYLFGVEWRDVIQRPQLNRDFEAERVYSNGFEPSADVFPLFVRSVWNDIHPVSAWKHTIPDAYKTVLIPSHDVDATSGYNLMRSMSDYEKSVNLKSIYFMTTRYFRDDIAKPYYTEENIELTRKLIANGHTIGCHSVGHFPDFSNDDLFPLGSLSVTKETYNPQYIDGKTENASTYGELKVSKELLEADLNVNIRSFRPGHLLTNSFVTEGLRNLDYSFHTAFTACDVLTGFPFFERMGQDWGGELSTVMQIPIHTSDVFKGDNISEENYLQKADIWFDVLNSHKNNYAPCVLLVHPNRDWKTYAQQALIDKMDRTECGLYNFEAYGDFWIARNDFKFEFDYQAEEQQLIIRASKTSIGKSATIGVMVESELPIKSYHLIDNDFTEYPVSVTSFGVNKNLVLIK